MDKNKDKKKNIAKKKGGIFINTTDYKGAFEKFLENSKIKFLTKGTSGLTFIATLNEGVDIENNYVYSSSVRYGEKIKYLILKIGFNGGLNMDPSYFHTPTYTEYKKLEEVEETRELTDIQKYTKDNLEKRLLDTICFIYNKIEIAYTEETDFLNEVNLQCQFYLNSIEYLQPICPGIVFSNIYKKHEETEKLLKILFNNAENEFTKRFIAQIGNKYSNKIYSNLTIIGMEYVETTEKAETLWNCVVEYYKSDKKDILREQYEQYVNMGRFIVLYLALRTGYTHGDFHLSNIMINKNDTTYFKGYKGSPVIIDFGYTQKIEENKMKEIMELSENKKYVEALRILCTINRSDDLDMNENAYIKFYGWICGNYNVLEEMEDNSEEYWNTTNIELEKLFKARISAIHDLVDEFKQKHENEPEKYPLLPLERSFIFGKTFHGIERDKKRQITEIS